MGAPGFLRFDGQVLNCGQIKGRGEGVSEEGVAFIECVALNPFQGDDFTVYSEGVRVVEVRAFRCNFAVPEFEAQAVFSGNRDQAGPHHRAGFDEPVGIAFVVKAVSLVLDLCFAPRNGLPFGLKGAIRFRGGCEGQGEVYRVRGLGLFRGGVFFLPRALTKRLRRIVQQPLARRIPGNELFP